MGRVVFFSRYPSMLNMAVETFRVLLELRGWQGLCQSIVHARDVKIYLEVGGPFFLLVESASWKTHSLFLAFGSVL